MARLQKTFLFALVMLFANCKSAIIVTTPNKKSKSARDGTPPKIELFARAYQSNAGEATTSYTLTWKVSDDVTTNAKLKVELWRAQSTSEKFSPSADDPIYKSFTGDGQLSESATTAVSSYYNYLLKVFDEAGNSASATLGVLLDTEALTASSTLELTSISPDTGPVTGGTTITVIGKNLRSDTVLKFGTATCSLSKFTSATRVECITPANKAGLYDLVATNYNGQTATLAGAFAFGGHDKWYAITSPTGAVLNAASGLYYDFNQFVDSKLYVWPYFAGAQQGVIYDYMNDSWSNSTVANLTPWGGYFVFNYRTGHYAASIGNYFFMVAGQTGGGTFLDEPVFNGNNGISAIKHNFLTEVTATTNMTNAPAYRRQFFAAHSSSKIFVFGGVDGVIFEPSADLYDIASDTWTTTAALNRPGARAAGAAAWTGSEFFVWGGGNWAAINNGATYNPSTDVWTTLPAAPIAGRLDAYCVTVEGKVYIFGGGSNQGAIYDPGTSSWSLMSTVGAPSDRTHASGPTTSYSVVTYNKKIFIWGGFSAGFLNDGAVYDTTTNTWSTISAIGAPTQRSGLIATWTGTSVLVVGGANGAVLQDGAYYVP